MSLFSFLRKNKQESASDEGAYYSRAEEDSKTVRNRGKRKPASTGGRDDALDPVLPEKKRARRRLIGAVALVLAAVIGLPMILDAEPNPLAEDIAIQIPSRDSAVPAPGAAAKPSDAERVATVASDPVEEVVAAPQPVPTATEAAPAPKAPPLAAPVSTAAVAAVAPPPTAVPVTARADSPARIDETARALALLEGRPDPRPAEKKAEKFVVQIAALASQEKVNELQSRLKDAGIKSYTQKVATEGGERTRVRVGPFANRDEAEKMRARIAKLGLNGTLVPA